MSNTLVIIIKLVFCTCIQITLETALELKSDTTTITLFSDAIYMVV